MRIRKNKNLSHASGVEPHVCQLNQSPWDVILFPSPLDSPYHQFSREESYNNGNESLGDSIGALESVWSMMNGSPDNYLAATRMKANNMIIDVDDDDNHNTMTEKKITSLSEDNRERELVKLKKNSINGDAVGLSGAAASAKKLRSRGKAGGKRAKKGHATASSTNPYEFYYYSGFGPSWGRKRRGEMTSRSSTVDEGATAVSSVGISKDTTPSSTSSLIGNKSGLELDYIDDEDDDEDGDDDDYENGDSGRKWRRKPVKSRSLKSLM